MHSFSKRFSFESEENLFTKALASLKKENKEIFDLTISNPTLQNFHYNEIKIIKSLQNPKNVIYDPDPLGNEKARESISKYYLERNENIPSENIILSTGTSDLFSNILKVYTDPGDNILLPSPGYPLFDIIAGFENLEVKKYKIFYDENKWKLDLQSIINGIDEKTKLLCIVEPNNPTGMILSREDKKSLSELSNKYKLIIIQDEVFSDYSIQNIYPFPEGTPLIRMNGISKTLCLPQIKLSWGVLSGSEQFIQSSIQKFEFILDTFLSVSSVSQNSIEQLFETKNEIQSEVRSRILNNYNFLKKNYQHTSEYFAGWYSILFLEKYLDDEKIAIELMNETGVVLQPGYFFDLEQPSLVAYLITDEAIFKKAVSLFSDWILSSNL